MARGTLPGTIQIRVIADEDQTEEVSKGLREFLTSQGFDVIDCTPDFQDRFDPTRKKFHIVAIPGEKK